MKSLIKIAMVAAVLSVSARQAHAVSFATLAQTQGSITVGDKKFSKFGAIAGHDAMPSDIEVVPVGSGTPQDPWGIIFTGSFSSGAGGTKDYAFEYKVQTISGQPLIVGIGQAISFGIIGNGLTVLDESAWSSGFLSGTLVGHSSVGGVGGNIDPIDPPGELSQNDILEFDQPRSAAWVVKDLQLHAEGEQSSVVVSIIQQTFPQIPVPDSGTTALLLGVGSIGLGLLRRRWVMAS